MKILFHMFVLLLIVSCTVQKEANRPIAAVVDYNKYNDFYISESVTADFKYVNLGKIYSRIMFEYNRSHHKNKLNSPQNAIKSSADDLYIADPQEVVDKLHQEAVNIGANGIIGFQLEYVPSLPPSYYASGVAIKK